MNTSRDKFNLDGNNFSKWSVTSILLGRFVPLFSRQGFMKSNVSFFTAMLFWSISICGFRLSISELAVSSFVTGSIVTASLTSGHCSV